MLIRLTMPALLLSLCVVTHAVAMTGLLRHLARSGRYSRFLPFWSSTWILIRIALVLVGAHLLEIAVWAGFFTWYGIFPPRTSFYFSSVTYTTVGYGDLILPEQWRLFAAVEGLTGILMCGWSTGVFFAVVSRMYPGQPAEKSELKRTVAS